MNDILRRYTNLPALIYLLSNRAITLLDPSSWDDSNDSHFLALYRDKKRLKCVLAMCFTQASERYHHWRVFGDGSSGICIQFIRSELLTALREAQPDLRTADVQYLTINRMNEQIRKKKFKTEDLPFTKRYPFEDEKEFRIIYESKSKHVSTMDISIPLSCIDRITISPWLSKPLVQHVRNIIKGIAGCSELRVVRSTLIGNDDWKLLGRSAK